MQLLPRTTQVTQWERSVQARGGHLRYPGCFQSSHLPSSSHPRCRHRRLPWLGCWLCPDRPRRRQSCATPGPKWPRSGAVPARSSCRQCPRTPCSSQSDMRAVPRIRGRGAAPVRIASCCGERLASSGLGARAGAVGGACYSALSGHCRACWASAWSAPRVLPVALFRVSGRPCLALAAAVLVCSRCQLMCFWCQRGWRLEGPASARLVPPVALLSTLCGVSTTRQRWLLLLKLLSRQPVELKSQLPALMIRCGCQQTRW